MKKIDGLHPPLARAVRNSSIDPLTRFAHNAIVASAVVGVTAAV